MDTQGNKYTMIYASIMVILVASGLSFTALTLKPYQDKNIEIEKKLNILNSVHLGLESNQQSNSVKYIEELYSKHITQTFLVDTKGNVVEGDAFLTDVSKEMSKPFENRHLPIFVCTKENNQKNYILPVYGRGLWGPIWGYVALKDDYNTIAGVLFDHKSETPGLGAEISTTEFQKQFDNKKLFDATQFVSVKIVKNLPSKDNPHAVDAVSGGTITSDGVDLMLTECLSGYIEYIKTQKNNQYEQ